LGYVFDLKLYQGYPRTSLLKQDKIRDNPGSFFAAPGGLPAAAGLRTPLGPGTIDLLASVLGLRHGKPPEALPPSAKLPQPRVHLVSVASPPAVRCGCIGGPMRESAGFEMVQMVWYCGSGVAIKEQGKQGHSTQHIVVGGHEQNWFRGVDGDSSCSLVVASSMGLLAVSFNSSNVLKNTRCISKSCLACSYPDWAACHPRGETSMRRTAVAKHTMIPQRGRQQGLQGKRNGQNDHAAILLTQGYLGLSLSISEKNTAIKGYPIKLHIYLGIHSSIAVLAHLERVASCPHYPPINLGLPLQTSKRVQRAAIPIPYHVPIQYIVQPHWRPAPSGIGLVRKPKVILQKPKVILQIQRTCSTCPLPGNVTLSQPFSGI
jgi:hypothetical protein